jgi:nucleoside-diphosphate-sugar epimerase/EAL domain-containing protein (putative c-di-GMP-specific phosphodiesterase class I)
MARYLVTGVAGFIGSWIAQRLVSQGHQVKGLDNMSSGTSANLATIGGAIEFRKGDIRNHQDVDEACRSVDGIFHQAAIASVQDSIERPLETNEINYLGTLNLIRAAKAQGVRRIVFASSSAIYGNQLLASLHEQMKPEPLSQYGVQKLSSEHALRVAQILDGLETVSLRYFNVFGPRQNASSPYSGVIAKFARYLTAGGCQEKPVIYGDGEQSRDFVYIEDVVDANLLAMSSPDARVPGIALNIGSGRSHTVNALVEHLRAITGEPLDLKHAPERMGDIRASSADISAAFDLLGYTPRWTLQEGLARTVSWYRGQGAKDNTRACSVSIPSPALSREAGMATEKHLCNALRQAAKEDEFRLAYQPIVDLRSGSVVGAEALLRWQRGGAMITAGQFIGVLEKCDLFDSVQDWVLREACQRAAWIHRELQRNFRIAVNVSPQQWTHQYFREAVNRALTESRCDPAMLDLEITERTALDNCQCVQAMMRCFRDQGIKLTIDDFGAGHANFTCLKQFPFNHLKIDRFYSQHANTRAKALGGIISSAQRAGVTCTAEGIETAAQLRQLKSLECDEAQGLHIARPMEFEGLVAFLGTRLVVDAQVRRQAC